MQVPGIAGGIGRALPQSQPIDYVSLLEEMRKTNDLIQQRKHTPYIPEGPTLQETIARLRQQYPYASYEQLSAMARGRAPKGAMYAEKVQFDKGVSDQGYGSPDDIMAGLFTAGPGGTYIHNRTKRAFKPDEARRYAEKIYEVQERRTKGIRTTYKRESMAGTPGSDPMSGTAIPPTPGATESQESFMQRMAAWQKDLDYARELGKITHTEYERAKRELLVAEANNRGLAITANSRIKVAEIGAEADKYGTDVNADVDLEKIASEERQSAAEIEDNKAQRIHEAEIVNLKALHAATLKEMELKAKGEIPEYWELYKNYLKTLAREGIEQSTTMVTLHDDISAREAAASLLEKMQFYAKMGYSPELIYQAVTTRYPNAFKPKGDSWQNVDKALYDKIQQLRLQKPQPLSYEQWAQMLGLPTAKPSAEQPAAGTPEAPAATTPAADTQPTTPATPPSPHPYPAPSGIPYPDDDDLDMLDTFGAEGPAGAAGPSQDTVEPVVNERSPLPQKQTLSPERQVALFRESQWNAVKDPKKAALRLKELIAQAKDPQAQGFAVRAALWDKYEELLRTGRTEDAHAAAEIFAELMLRG